MDRAAPPKPTGSAVSEDIISSQSRPDRSGRRPKRKEAREPLVGLDLVQRSVRVHPREVVFLKGVIEASEGVAVVFAVSGGELTLVTTPSQLRALDELLADLAQETGALFSEVES